MGTENDFLRQMLSSIPPDGGHTKQASSDAVSSVVSQALAGLEKAAMEEEKREEGSEGRPSPKRDVPPEFLAQRGEGRESEEPTEEEEEEEMKEALAMIGASVLQQNPELLSSGIEKSAHLKRAAQAQVARDEWNQKVAAAAYAAEMAKIAYHEMAGLDFSEYMEKTAGPGGWVANRAKSVGRGFRDLPGNIVDAFRREGNIGGDIMSAQRLRGADIDNTFLNRLKGAAGFGPAEEWAQYGRRTANRDDLRRALGTAGIAGGAAGLGVAGNAIFGGD